MGKRTFSQLLICIKHWVTKTNPVRLGNPASSEVVANHSCTPLPDSRGHILVLSGVGIGAQVEEMGSNVCYMDECGTACISGFLLSYRGAVVVNGVYPKLI